MRFAGQYMPSDDEINQLWEMYGHSNLIDLDNITLNRLQVRSLLGKAKSSKLKARFSEDSYLNNIIEAPFLNENGELARDIFNSKKITSFAKLNKLAKIIEDMEKYKFKQTPNKFIRASIIEGFVEYNEEGELIAK